MYTNLLYKNPSIEIINQNNYLSVICTSLIPLEEGSLLLLEHSLSSSNSAEIVNIINQNRDLYSFLCPRETSFSCRSIDISLNKVRSNLFQFNSLYLIGRYLSCVNHSCLVNSIVIYITIKSSFSIPIVIMAVYAIKTIDFNEEIVIMYGPNIGHSHNSELEEKKEETKEEKNENNNITYHSFICNCQLNKEEREEISLRLKSLVRSNDFHEKYFTHRNIIIAYLRNELQSSIIPSSSPLSSSSSSSPDEILEITPIIPMKNILIAQLLAIECGVYYTSETELLPLQRFHEYIAEHYQITSNSTDNDRMNALYAIIQKYEQQFDEFIQNISLEFST